MGPSPHCVPPVSPARGLLGSVPGLHPPDASSSPQVVTTEMRPDTAKRPRGRAALVVAPGRGGSCPSARGPSFKVRASLPPLELPRLVLGNAQPSPQNVCSALSSVSQDDSGVGLGTPVSRLCTP